MNRTLGPLAAISLTLVLALAATPVSAAPGQWGMSGFSWEASDAPDGLLPNVMSLHGVVSPASYAYFGVQMPAGVTLEDLDALAFDVKFDNGGCAGGSPRAGLNIDKDGDGDRDGTISVYAGAPPFSKGCIPVGGWSHQDLLDGAVRFDSTQLGGPYYGTREQAIAVAGEGIVLGMNFFYDSAWAFGEDVSVWFDNVEAGPFTLAEPGVADACGAVAGAGAPASLPIC